MENNPLNKVEKIPGLTDEIDGHKKAVAEFLEAELAAGQIEQLKSLLAAVKQQDAKNLKYEIENMLTKAANPELARKLGVARDKLHAKYRDSAFDAFSRAHIEEELDALLGNKDSKEAAE